MNVQRRIFVALLGVWTFVLSGMICFLLNGADSQAPTHQGLTAKEWRLALAGEVTLKEGGRYLFNKLTPLSESSICVLDELLVSQESSNIVVIVLDAIARNCGEDAGKLVPSIKKYLVSENLCQQLTALNALRSIGGASESATNDVLACLNSTNAIVRAVAAETMSFFGECAKEYLPLIENLYAHETNASLRDKYQQSINRIRRKSLSDVSSPEK